MPGDEEMVLQAELGLASILDQLYDDGTLPPLDAPPEVIETLTRVYMAGFENGAEYALDILRPFAGRKTRRGLRRKLHHG